MHAARKGLLVEQGAVELVEFGARLAFNEGAPEIDHALRPGGRLEAGEALAHQHRHGVLERRFLAVARLREGRAVVAVVEHGGEVRGDALHAAGADGFHPRLLDRVEQRARGGVLRRVALVDRLVVTGEAQGHGISEAAQDRRLARIGLARRLRQPRLGAVRARDQRRLVGREVDLEIRTLRHGARGRGERPLERLVRRLGLRAGLTIGGLDVDGRHDASFSRTGAAELRDERRRHAGRRQISSAPDQLSATFSALSGNS